MSRRCAIFAVFVLVCFPPGRAARAEAWPTFDDLASSRFLLIVHCRVQEIEGRKAFKLLEVWKGRYGPLAFAKQPPTGYIETPGPGGGPEVHAVGDEVILFYTNHNQSQEGISRHDMTLLVNGGKIIYPPETELFSGKRDYTVEEFRREITSRTDAADTEKRSVHEQETAEPRSDYSGSWRMLLPAGFEHETKMETLAGNRYRLRSPGSRFNGVYELRDRRLVIVEPEATRREGYVWEIRSPYLLTLIEHAPDLQHDYRGAVLFRSKEDRAERPDHPVGEGADAEIRTLMAQRGSRLERRTWTIRYHPIEGMTTHSAWHIDGTMWWVEIYPYSLDDLDKSAVYEIDAAALDQNYGVIQFYLYRLPKRVTQTERPGTK
jgi:hypothetical protein